MKLKVRHTAQDIQLKEPEEELALVFEAKWQLEIAFSTEDVRIVSLGH